MRVVKELIDEGKLLMSNSVNPTHDVVHVKAVQHHAIEIWRELKSKGKTKLTEEEILLAVWWHDVFKARFDNSSLLVDLLEGFGSMSILLNESKKKRVPFRKIKNVAIAIFVHNNPFAIYLNSLFGGGLIRILMEADGLDGFRENRIVDDYRKINSKVKKFIFLFLQKALRCIMLLNARTDYARKYLEHYECKLNLD